MQKPMRLFAMVGILGWFLFGGSVMEAPAQNGESKTAYILYSSSSHGYFDPCG